MTSAQTQPAGPTLRRAVTVWGSYMWGYADVGADIYAALGLDIISGTILFASMLRDKIIESRFSSYLIETKDLGVIEIEVKKDLIGKAIQDINIPGEFLVVALKRLEGVSIPQPSTVLKEKDTLMAAMRVASLKKIKEKFGI